MAIIIKPIVTEKMTAMADKLNRYGSHSSHLFCNNRKR